jgi:hypothetical protein
MRPGTTGLVPYLWKNCIDGRVGRRYTTRAFLDRVQKRMRQVRVNSAITKLLIKLPGGSSEAAPPVPIPNTEVKRLSADDTALVTVWENRSLPGGFSFTRIRSTFPKLAHAEFGGPSETKYAPGGLRSAYHW